MSRRTRATDALERAGVTFSVHAYDYDPNADRIGEQAAEALGEPASRVLKTLMAVVDGKPVCVLVPSDCEVSMKKLAAVFGGKSAQMMKPADAERATGYKVGGISPFGQMRKALSEYEQGRFFSKESARAVRRAGEDGLLALAAHIVISPTVHGWVTEGPGFKVNFEFFYLGLIAFAIFITAIGRVLHAAAAIKAEHDQIV